MTPPHATEEMAGGLPAVELIPGTEIMKDIQGENLAHINGSETL
jgi:hypothetical protein